MFKTKPKKNGKINTITGLASVVQREFSSLRSDIVKEIADLREEMNSRFDAADNRGDALEHTLAEVVRLMREEQRRTTGAIQDIETRLARVERKLGL